MSHRAFTPTPLQCLLSNSRLNFSSSSSSSLITNSNHIRMSAHALPHHTQTHAATCNHAHAHTHHTTPTHTTTHTSQFHSIPHSSFRTHHLRSSYHQRPHLLNSLLVSWAPSSTSTFCCRSLSTGTNDPATTEESPPPSTDEQYYQVGEAPEVDLSGEPDEYGWVQLPARGPVPPLPRKVMQDEWGRSYGTFALDLFSFTLFPHCLGCL